MTTTIKTTGISIDKYLDKDQFDVKAFRKLAEIQTERESYDDDYEFTYSKFVTYDDYRYYIDYVKSNLVNFDVNFPSSSDAIVMFETPYCKSDADADLTRVKFYFGVNKETNQKFVKILIFDLFRK